MFNYVADHLKPVVQSVAKCRSNAIGYLLTNDTSADTGERDESEARNRTESACDRSSAGAKHHRCDCRRSYTGANFDRGAGK